MAKCSENRGGDCTLFYRGEDGDGAEGRAILVNRARGCWIQIPPFCMSPMERYLYKGRLLSCVPFPLPLGDALRIKATFPPSPRPAKACRAFSVHPLMSKARLDEALSKLVWWKVSLPMARAGTR